MQGKPISTWAASISLQSPNRKYHAEILETGEIAMGAPTSGTLKLNDGRMWGSCNPSIVWSNDSKYLAVPQWTRNRNQKLLVIDVEGKQTFYAKGEFQVLQLESFENGVITGLDSPIYKTSMVRIELADILK